MCNKIFKSHLEPSKESFCVWSQNVIKDTTLHNQLDAHLDDELKNHVKHSEAKKEKTLKSWVDAVRHLDETCISENKHHCEFIEESLNKHQSKRQANDANALRNKTNCTNNSTLSLTSNSTYIPLRLVATTFMINQ